MSACFCASMHMCMCVLLFLPQHVKLKSFGIVLSRLLANAVAACRSVNCVKYDYNKQILCDCVVCSHCGGPVAI